MSIGGRSGNGERQFDGDRRRTGGETIVTSDEEDEEFARALAGSFRGQRLAFLGRLDQIEAAIRDHFWGRMFLRLFRWRR